MFPSIRAFGVTLVLAAFAPLLLPFLCRTRWTDFTFRLPAGIRDQLPAGGPTDAAFSLPEFYDALLSYDSRPQTLSIGRRSTDWLEARVHRSTAATHARVVLYVTLLSFFHPLRRFYVLRAGERDEGGDSLCAVRFGVIATARHGWNRALVRPSRRERFERAG